MTYRVYLCGVETECPHDGEFEHRGWPFGCVPRDFSERTGRSRTHHQRSEDVPGYGDRYRWDGGCDAAGVIPHGWTPSTAKRGDVIVLDMDVGKPR